MTKTEAIREYRRVWDYTVSFIPSLNKDKIAKRESWVNFVDALQRDGRISDKQADSWSNPF